MNKLDHHSVIEMDNKRNSIEDNDKIKHKFNPFSTKE